VRALTARVAGALNDARWRHGVFWPLLVRTDRAWEEYVAGLSESGRRYLRKALKLNAGRTLRVVPFDGAQVRSFMDLWGRHYAFAPDFFSKLEALEKRGRMTCFAAVEGDRTVAVQLVETYGPYGRCHAPWFDKDALEASNLATFMWFGVLEHAMRERAFAWLDLGGGPLARLPSDHYKRRYAPEASPAVLRRCAACAFMFVVDPPRRHACPGCGTDAPLSWRGRAVLAVSRVPKPGRARTRRTA
jgi:hypothetical protein